MNVLVTMMMKVNGKIDRMLKVKVISVRTICPSTSGYVNFTKQVLSWVLHYIPYYRTTFVGPSLYPYKRLESD
jgi:hypothetical protein